MPNWCSNIVQFEGSAFGLRQVQELFEAMAAKEQEQGCGQLPAFITDERGYFFSIHWEDDALYYETKWSPNTDTLVEIAVRLDLNFVQEYDEPMMLVFGKAEYADGILQVTDLDDEDFDAYQYDEEKDNYLFEGDYYESDYEIKEILLERKQQI